MSSTETLDIFDEVRAERARAHVKHGDTSMESSSPDTLRRLAILTEEVGEVAKEFNDAEHDGRPVDLAALRKELIQTAAMAAAWADACETDRTFTLEGDTPQGDVLNKECSLCHVTMGTGSCLHLLDLGDGRIVLPRHVWNDLIADRHALRELRRNGDE